MTHDNPASRRRSRLPARLGLLLLALTGLAYVGAAPAGAAPARAAATASRPAPATASGPAKPTRPDRSAGTAAPAGTAKPRGAGRARPTNSPQWTVRLTASPNDLWPTQFSTLTAVSNMDVGPTPFWLRIYDTTSGTLIANCGSGTACSATVTQPAPTTHGYVARVEDAVGNQAASDPQFFPLPVSWHGATLTLAASEPTQHLGGASVLTATSSEDVGPSPYWIEIFDTTTGERLTDCGTGTACSATVSLSSAGTHKFVAYIAGNSVTAPPPNVLEVSATTWVTWSDHFFNITLTGPSSASAGSTVTLTATSNVALSPTGDANVINFEDADGDVFLGSCSSGVRCSIPYVLHNQTSHLVAFIVGNSQIQATSNPLTIESSVIIK